MPEVALKTACPHSARTWISRLAAVSALVAGALLASALLAGVLLTAAESAAQAGSPGRYRSGDAARMSHLMARAQRGDAHAQAVLGFMYANGHGVPQSYEMAVDWYLKSARQGDPDGQYLLGLMYDKGFGVNVDVVKAYKWLNLATAYAPPRNRESFLRMRNAVGSKMTPAQLDLAQQLAVDFIPTRQ